MLDSHDPYDPHGLIDPQDLVRVEARVPRGLLSAARHRAPYGATTSDLIRRGLAALAGIDPPVVKTGRHTHTKETS